MENRNDSNQQLISLAFENLHNLHSIFVLDPNPQLIEAYNIVLRRLNELNSNE